MTLLGSHFEPVDTFKILLRVNAVADRQQFAEFELGTYVTFVGRFQVPVNSQVSIDRDPFAEFVHMTDQVHGSWLTLVCGADIPAQGLGIILVHSLAKIIHEADLQNSLRVSPLGRLTKIFESLIELLLVVKVHADAEIVQICVYGFSRRSIVSPRFDALRQQDQQTKNLAEHYGSM